MKEFNAAGHLDLSLLKAIGVPHEADFYLCGPSTFLEDFTRGLAQWGIPSAFVHSEVFGAGPALTPGIVNASRRSPHMPDQIAGTGPAISFARSGLTVPWDPTFHSLLELAEACDVPVRWSCRTGVCHNCECGLISGTVHYEPKPLDAPAIGNVLICCSQPQGAVVLDL